MAEHRTTKDQVSASLKFETEETREIKFEVDDDGELEIEIESPVGNVQWFYLNREQGQKLQAFLAQWMLS